MGAKIVLTGRPTEMARGSQHITLAMEASITAALPKGLPAPTGKTTKYVVYVALKAWNKNGIDEALKKDETDFLIVEGVLEHAPGGIAVYTTSVTTRNVQRAAKDKQLAKA